MKIAKQIDELLNEVSVIYKLINFTDVEEPYKENARQARKKLNKIVGTLNKLKRNSDMPTPIKSVCYCTICGDSIRNGLCDKCRRKGLVAIG